MSHEIIAFQTDLDYEVATLHRSSSSNKNKEIYLALNCLEYYGGCSGTGDSKIFNELELREALRYLSYRDKVSEEIRFIADCLEYKDKLGNIKLLFG